MIKITKKHFEIAFLTLDLLPQYINEDIVDFDYFDLNIIMQLVPCSYSDIKKTITYLNNVGYTFSFNPQDKYQVKMDYGFKFKQVLLQYEELFSLSKLGNKLINNYEQSNYFTLKAIDKIIGFNEFDSLVVNEVKKTFTPHYKKFYFLSVDLEYAMSTNSIVDVTINNIQHTVLILDSINYGLSKFYIYYEPSTNSTKMIDLDSITSCLIIDQDEPINFGLITYDKNYFFNDIRNYYIELIVEDEMFQYKLPIYEMFSKSNDVIDNVEPKKIIVSVKKTKVDEFIAWTSAKIIDHPIYTNEGIKKDIMNSLFVD